MVGLRRSNEDGEFVRQLWPFLPFDGGSRAVKEERCSRILDSMLTTQDLGERDRYLTEPLSSPTGGHPRGARKMGEDGGGGSEPWEQGLDGAYCK